MMQSLVASVRDMEVALPDGQITAPCGSSHVHPSGKNF
jgi:hypothetical protein